MYGRDVFLSEQQIGNFFVGSQIKFTVTLNRQGFPQAQALEDATVSIRPKRETPKEGRNLTTVKRLRAEPPPGSPERYNGQIRQFDVVKQYGFIECADVHQMYGFDVFLAAAAKGDFNIGSLVSFRIEIKNGKPQAHDLVSAM